jgi:hypothetical protein
MKGSSEFPTLTARCTRYESEAGFRDVSELSVTKALTQSSLLIDIRMKYRDSCDPTLTSHFALRPFGEPEFSIVRPLKQ